MGCSPILEKEREWEWEWLLTRSRTLRPADRLVSAWWFSHIRLCSFYSPTGPGGATSCQHSAVQSWSHPFPWPCIGLAPALSPPARCGSDLPRSLGAGGGMHGARHLPKGSQQPVVDPPEKPCHGLKGPGCRGEGTKGREEDGKDEWACQDRKVAQAFARPSTNWRQNAFSPRLTRGVDRR